LWLPNNIDDDDQHYYNTSYDNNHYYYHRSDLGYNNNHYYYYHHRRDHLRYDSFGQCPYFKSNPSTNKNPHFFSDQFSDQCSELLCLHSLHARGARRSW
jgi:hypothetical protein